MGEKRMPFMNFKLVNAKILYGILKTLLEYGISIHLHFNH